MDVPSFCADVQPFTLEGQVAESYSVERRRGEEETGVRKRAVREKARERQDEERGRESVDKLGDGVGGYRYRQRQKLLENHSTSHYNERERGERRGREIMQNFERIIYHSTRSKQSR